jgi:hypothetical protein
MRQLHYGVGVRTTDPAWWEYIDGLRDIHDLTPRSHADHHKQSLTPYLPFFFTWHTTPNVADALAGLSNDEQWSKPSCALAVPKHIRSRCTTFACTTYAQPQRPAPHVNTSVQPTGITPYLVIMAHHNLIGVLTLASGRNDARELS